MKCMQCQSGRIVRDAKAVDYIDLSIKKPLKLELDADPDAWIFKGTEAGTLKANICVDCGFVMFSMATSDAEKLYGLQESRRREF